MQRIQLNELLGRVHGSYTFKDGTIHFGIGSRRYEIPTDGVFTVVDFTRFIADKFGIPSDLVELPEGYTVGRAGRRFGFTPDRYGDVDAYLRLARDPENEMATVRWGGIFETAVKDLYRADGAPLDYTGRTPSYVNVHLPVEEAENYVRANPDLRMFPEGRGCRVYGGWYRHASCLTPPLELTRLSRWSPFRPEASQPLPEANQYEHMESTVKGEAARYLNASEVLQLRSSVLPRSHVKLLHVIEDVVLELDDVVSTNVVIDAVEDVARGNEAVAEFLLGHLWLFYRHRGNDSTLYRVISRW